MLTMAETLSLLNEFAYLTGSRYFGTATFNSDFDFFAEQRPMSYSQDWEGDWRVVVEADLVYQDKSIIQLFKHRIYPIHFQYVYDAQRKLKAQNFLATCPIPLLSCNKMENKKIWNWALA